MESKQVLKLNAKLLEFCNLFLEKNKKFQNIHSEEECYIFGNGASLKSMDFEMFSDKVSIGSNSLFLHKDFNKLDCRYYALPTSFLFHRYRKFYNQWQRNYLGEMYKEKIEKLGFTKNEIAERIVNELESIPIKSLLIVVKSSSIGFTIVNGFCAPMIAGA